MSDALIAASGVDAGYHGNPVVRDLHVDVRPGEVVALLGPNGAGKTTTILALSGVLRPLRGNVLVNGKPTESPLYVRARNGLALVTEERSVFMRLSVAENLRVGRADVARALDIFPELEPLMRRKAGLLSGGEQQMLTLARALSRRPTVLLADELSLGLAPLTVRRLLSALRTAADLDGTGVFLVEQHVAQAREVADRMYVMQRGRIVAQGSGAELDGKLAGLYLAGPGASSNSSSPA